MTPEERFWSKVNKTDSCWLWTAGTLSDGYGSANYRGYSGPAHRIAYKICIEDIPREILVRHTCDNRLCVNPSHLIKGTHLQNARDSVLRKRRVHQTGKNHWTRRHPEWQFFGTKHKGRYKKLTENEVIQIKTLHNTGQFTYSDLARQFNTVKSTIRHIMIGLVWKHVQITVKHPVLQSS